MTLNTKVGGAWKEVSSLKVKIGGEWKDVSTLYSKKDGAWVTVYSSGALIEFADYPYPIPVAKGWQYKATTINVNVTNLITDPSVENGGWSDATVDTSQALFGSKSLKLPSGTTSVPSISVETPIVGHIYYGRRYCKSDGDNQPADKRFEVYGGDGTGLNWVIAYNSGNYPDWTMQSKRWTVSAVNATSYVVRSFHVNGTANFWQDGFMLIDLTACFGAGNEPTQAWCDANIPFFEGTQQLSVTITDDTWTKITSDGEINISGTFTGFVKANSITLSEYYTETISEQIGARTDGESLNIQRYDLTSFVNNSRGYVCGGNIDGSATSEVDVYDSSGNRTTGTSLGNKRYGLTSFVNGSKGYVCGGAYLGFDAMIDVYDSSGNRTHGGQLSNARSGLTSFVNDSNGYVCGGYNGDYISTVDILDSSGNKTTGTSLSKERTGLTSFTNGSKGYVCGGTTGGSAFSVVDVYDPYGNRTTGTSLSVGRNYLTSFVNNSRGYVCGGKNDNGYSSVVDLYDLSGNRTNGISLSIARRELTSFSNDSKGYVCGGVGSPGVVNTVDVYYDQPESYKTKLPITQGSTYTLNGESGTATESKILEFDSAVSGTIKYKRGGILTDVVLLEFTDYPYAIPVAAGWKYSIGGSDWNEITVDGEINTNGGTFTGSIWANSITLNDYYTEHIEAQEGARMDGQSLSTTRRVPVSFVNNGKGYVCTDTTDVYDISGNRTSGNPPITNANGGVSFILSDKAYLCAGFNSGTTVSVYDSFGNVTTGNNIAYSRGDKATAFVNGNKGYVCGGQSSSGNSEARYVEVFDISGNVTSGTSISEAKAYLCSFVNNSKGYVCGGYNNVNINNGSTVVDVYDSSGNRTTGQSLSAAFVMASTFVNDNKGYVCAGGKFSIPRNTVNIYDSSGNMTVGQALSVSRYEATAFVLNNNGYVCGGTMNPGCQSTVDVYDTSGNRTLGNELSVARNALTSFVNGNKGYVCGGIETDTNSAVVDVYYHQPESWFTKLPITEGSTYNLNGESGTADVSKVMEFDSKVSGTINYVKGTIPVN